MPRNPYYDYDHPRDGSGPSESRDYRTAYGYDLVARGDLARRSSAPRAVVLRTASGVVVADEGEGKTFPPYGRVCQASPRSLERIKNVLSKVPWWDPIAIRDPTLMKHYTDNDGILADGLPDAIVGSYDFHKRCQVPEADLIGGHADRNAWYRHIRDVYQRESRMPRGDAIPLSYGVEIYCFRTYGEQDFVWELCQLDTTRWRGVRDVAQAAICFQRPVLRAEFSYQQKSTKAFWSWIKWERRMRRNDALLVPYHCVEYQNIRSDRSGSRYPATPTNWKDVEVPLRCYAELPPVVAYKGSELQRDMFIGWWCVFYTEWAIKVSSFILSDAYDRHQLWRLPSPLMEWILRLDVSFVLGSNINQEDLHHLLDVIEDTDWQTGEVVLGKPEDGVAGAEDRTAEFIFYNTWARERIDARAAAQLRRRSNRRRMPDGYPTGFFYDPPLPLLAVSDLGWVPRNALLILSDHYGEEEDGSLVYVGSPPHESHGASGESAGPSAVTADKAGRHLVPILQSAPAPPRLLDETETAPASGSRAQSDIVEIATGELLGQVGVGAGRAADTLRAAIIELIRRHLQADSNPTDGDEILVAPTSTPSSLPVASSVGASHSGEGISVITDSAGDTQMTAGR